MSVWFFLLGGMWQKSLYYSLDSIKCVIALVSGGYLSSVVCQEEFNIAMYRCHQTVSIMIDYSLFYVPLKNFWIFIMPHLRSSDLIRRTAPFSRLLRHTRGCGGSILPRILTGPLSVAFYDTHGDAEDLFQPGSSRG